MTAPKVELVKRAVALWKEKRALKDKLKKIDAQLADIEPKALDWMQANTIPSMKQNGVTAYIRRELWASMAEGADMDALWNALEGAGFNPDDVIKERANSQTLSAIVREFDQRNEPLPEPLASVLKTSEVYKMGYQTAPITSAKRSADAEKAPTSIAA